MHIWSAVPPSLVMITRKYHYARKSPKETFRPNAAKGSKEPTPDLLILCCVRSQRGECCVSVKLGAAAQREHRPFVKSAARVRGRIHRMRSVAVFRSRPETSGRLSLDRSSDRRMYSCFNRVGISDAAGQRTCLNISDVRQAVQTDDLGAAFVFCPDQGLRLFE